MTPTLRVRWLGSVPYARRARAAARAVRGRAGPATTARRLAAAARAPARLHARACGPTSATCSSTRPTVGAELVRTDRGGDVTYHGPGQLVGYPILTVPGKRGGGMADTVAYVRGVEQLVIDVLADLGLPDVGRLAGYPGRVGRARRRPSPARSPPSACGSRRGRSMHGFALNVEPDMTFFGHIVPCGIADKARHVAGRRGRRRHDARGRRRGRRPGRRALGRGAWSARRGGATARDVACATRTRATWPPFSPSDRSSAAAAVGPVAGAHRHDGPATVRLAEAGVSQGLSIGERKPTWLRAPARMGPRLPRSSSARCATSTWSPCARRPAAPTSSSAGPTAPPRS